MAMAAVFRREGRRMAAPLMTRHSIRSSIVPSEVQVGFGVRFIWNQIVPKIVRNIQEINKIMMKFSAAKLRSIQTKTENSRGLWQPFTALLGDTPSVDVKKNVIVTIFSNKGLCGENNSTSVKISRALHKINSGPGKESKYVVLGELAKAQLNDDFKKHIELLITELQKNPLNYTQVALIADEILKNVEYDALRVVFNKFESVVSFIPTTSTVLSPEVVERESKAGGTLGKFGSYEIKGGGTKSEVLQNLTEFQFSCVMFNAVLENACSEQGTRAFLVDRETRNALDELNRVANSNEYQKNERPRRKSQLHNNWTQVVGSCYGLILNIHEQDGNV